jgi:hypothetical protein
MPICALNTFISYLGKLEHGSELSVDHLKLTFIALTYLPWFLIYNCKVYSVSNIYKLKYIFTYLQRILKEYECKVPFSI